ncbi:hypothetical protein ASE02_09170 [Phenylobacterium sp. Root700]|nr:hypothetical protein ASE02_09170 [Phenylobacterium sp. Root700]
MPYMPIAMPSPMTRMAQVSVAASPARPSRISPAAKIRFEASSTSLPPRASIHRAARVATNGVTAKATDIRLKTKVGLSARSAAIASPRTPSR